MFNIFKSSLFKSAGVYTLSNIINSAVPFFLLPILTRYLSPYEYGLTATFLVLVGFITPFAGLSVQGAIAREYYDREKIDLPEYITNALLIFVVSSVLISLIIFLFDDAIAEVAEFPVEWLWAAATVSLSQFIIQVVLTLWQVQVKPVVYGIYQVSQSIMIFVFAVWFVIGLDQNWKGFVLANVYSKILFALLGFFILYKDGWIKLRINFTYIKDALKFGIPLVPHAFGGWLRMSADRILINNLVSVAEQGIYSVGYQVSNIITLLETSFNNAWVPWFYEKLKIGESRTKKKIVTFTYIYIFAALLFSIVFALLIPYFLEVFVGKDFYAASRFIIWLSIGKALEALYFMTCNYLFYEKKTMYITFITFTISILHVGLSYLLIKNYGSIGAAQAAVFSSLFTSLLTWYFAAKFHKMPWFSKR